MSAFQFIYIDLVDIMMMIYYLCGFDDDDVDDAIKMKMFMIMVMILLRLRTKRYDAHILHAYCHELIS